MHDHTRSKTPYSRTKNTSFHSSHLNELGFAERQHAPIVGREHPLVCCRKGGGEEAVKDRFRNTLLQRERPGLLARAALAND